jgi:hypothetical protein
MAASEPWVTTARAEIKLGDFDFKERLDPDPVVDAAKKRDRYC